MTRSNRTMTKRDVSDALLTREHMDKNLRLFYFLKVLTDGQSLRPPALPP
jgi:hypothetical protein